MKLIYFELSKLFGNKYTFIGLSLVLAANLFITGAVTRNQAKFADSAAHRMLVSDLAGLSVDDKYKTVDDRYSDILDWIEIDKYLHRGVPANERAIFEELLSRHDINDLEKFALYTADLYTERDFLSMTRSELGTVANYPSFLEDIQNQAERFSNVSIFTLNNAYGTLNIEKTASDYKKMEGRDFVFDYFPQRGLVTAVNAGYTDIFILIGLLLISGILITVERDSGMMDYVRSMPEGRAGTAMAKCMVLAIAAFLFILLLYGSNMIYCSISYGIGPLNRSIQSIPFLMRSTLPISLVAYLLLFVVAKWFGALVMGMSIMIIVLVSKSFISGVFFSFLFYAANLTLFSVIKTNSAAGFLKYLNVSGIMRVNDWLGGYFNFNVWERPVSVFFVVLFGSILFLILFFIGFIVSFLKQQISVRIPLSIAGKSRMKPTTLFREEVYKNILTNGAGALLFFALVFLVFQGVQSESLITAEEIYYRYYMLPLSGEYNYQKYNYIVSELKSPEFMNTYEADRLYASGLISKKEYDIYYSQNYSAFKRRETLERIIDDNITRVTDDPKASLVYETGYKLLFDKDDKIDLPDTLFSNLLIIICLSNIFTHEKIRGMQRFIDATPLGRKPLILSKLKIAVSVSAASTVIILIPRYIQVIRDYGLPAFFASARSLQEYQSLPAFISIASICVIAFLGRLLSNLFVSLAILYLSKTMKTALSVVFTGALFFCGPVILSMTGIGFMKHFSLYPLFRIPAMLSNGKGVVHISCIIVLLLVFGNILIERFGLRKAE